jgi:hypothetical protein
MSVYFTNEETKLEWLKEMSNAVDYDDDIAPEIELASLRDSLLPKLMRGEVRVREVEI